MIRIRTILFALGLLCLIGCGGDPTTKPETQPEKTNPNPPIKPGDKPKVTPQ